MDGGNAQDGDAAREKRRQKMKLEIYTDQETNQQGFRFTAEDASEVGLLDEIFAPIKVVPPDSICVLQADIVPDDIEQHPEGRIVNGILMISPAKFKE